MTRTINPPPHSPLFYPVDPAHAFEHAHPVNVAHPVELGHHNHVWLRSEATFFHAFVVSWKKAILDGSRADQWRHSPGRKNPVDDGTREGGPRRPPSCISSMDHWTKILKDGRGSLAKKLP
jgi:hypothetical protein